MNDSYRNNEVEYCSRKIPGFQLQDTTPDPPCIIIIYLEYTWKITA